jgi:hypothetical protein
MPNHANDSRKCSECSEGRIEVLGYLLLDLVCAAEHAVNAGKVVCAGEETVSLSLRGVVLLKVGFLAEVAHLWVALVTCIAS